MSIPQHHFSTSFSSLSRLNSTRYSELAGKTQLCSSLPPSLHFPHPSFPSPLFLLPLPLPYLFPPTPLLPSPYHPPPPNTPHNTHNTHNPSNRVFLSKCPPKSLCIRRRRRLYLPHHVHVHSNPSLPPFFAPLPCVCGMNGLGSCSFL